MLRILYQSFKQDDDAKNYCIEVERETAMVKKELKIIIWGVGNKGKYRAKQIKENYEYLELAGFGDNDTEKIGNCYDDVMVYGIEEVKRKQENIDCVIIAVSDADVDDVFQQLVKELKVPIYRDIFELTNKRFSIDITGWCNAKCKWCHTGRKNRMGKSCEKRYMKYENFVNIHQHLKKSGILHPFQEIMLYSWGEPFLNPDYLKIIDYLARENQIFSLSTNASCPQYTTNSKVYEGCKTAIFSLSGMTKESYERIHGFDIEIIKENIRKMICNMRQNGFKGQAALSFHVYRFNQNELEMARKFSEETGMIFEPIYAYFASMSLLEKYLHGEMCGEELRDAKEELILEHSVGLMSQKPSDWRCPVENIVSIDSDGVIELCCCSDADMKNFKWCSIFDMENVLQWQKYRMEMLNSTTCLGCRDGGAGYWMLNNPILK